MDIRKGTKLKLRWQFLNEGEPVSLSDYSRFRLDVLDGKNVPQRTSVALSSNEVVFVIDTALYDNGQYAVMVDANGADGGLHVCHHDAFRIVPSNAESSLAKGGNGENYELTVKVDLSGQLSTPSFSGSYNDLTDKPDLSKYYEKPSNGIPKNDMSSAVKSSLSKADSALQNESDPTVPQCVKDISQSDIDNWNNSSNPLPTGGSDGDVLVYRYGSAQWESPQGGIPSGGQPGQVLTIGPGGDPTWEYPQYQSY